MSRTSVCTFAVLLSSTALVACRGMSSTSTTTSPAPPGPTTAGSATPDAHDAAILLAVQGWSFSFDSAVREMNPDDPALPQTATGDEIVMELTSLNSWKIQGITATGDLPHVIDSHIVLAAPTMAEVKACIYDPGVLIYKATGKIVPTNNQGQFYLDVHATLRFEGGAWKVSHSTIQSEVTACLPGF